MWWQCWRLDESHSCLGWQMNFNGSSQEGSWVSSAWNFFAKKTFLHFCDVSDVHLTCVWCSVSGPKWHGEEKHSGEACKNTFFGVGNLLQELRKWWVAKALSEWSFNFFTKKSKRTFVSSKSITRAGILGLKDQCYTNNNAAQWNSTEQKPKKHPFLFVDQWVTNSQDLKFIFVFTMFDFWPSALSFAGVYAT